MTPDARWQGIRAVGQLQTSAARLAGPFALACFLAVSGIGAQTPSTTPVPLPSNPQPIHPAEAARDAAIGRVEVEIDVGIDGKARSSRVIHVAPVRYGFERAVQDAVRGWVFEPARANGAAIAGTYRHVFELGMDRPASLARWTPQGRTNVSLAERDSLMRVSRAAGWIHTRRFFSEYSLRLAFRLTNPGTKAAVLVHAIEEWNRPRTGYRINLTEETQGPESVGRIAGLNVPVDELAFYPAGARAAHGTGQWETLEVRSADGRIETTLNGVPVCAIVDGRFTGFIGFEVSAGAIEVRSAEIVRQDSFLGGDFTIAAARLTSKMGPKVVREVKPQYSPQAMRDKVQGTVILEAVVDGNGKIVQTRIRRSLEIDLDQAAVAAARQWRFEPATTDGRPVPVIVSIEMTFTLR